MKFSGEEIQTYEAVILATTVSRDGLDDRWLKVLASSLVLIRTRSDRWRVNKPVGAAYVTAEGIEREVPGVGSPNQFGPAVSTMFMDVKFRAREEKRGRRVYLHMEGREFELVELLDD